MSPKLTYCSAWRFAMWSLAVLALAPALVMEVQAAGGATVQEVAAKRRSASGLPVPRYVSLKSDKVNIRQGPGIDYQILWVFRRAGLPVEVVKEYQGWRQIRDADGGTGWVYGPMLSGRRTALILPWKLKSTTKVHTELRERKSAGSRILAFVQAGVLANLKRCDGQWCSVSIDNIPGFIEQKKLWGIYPDEKLK